jgi:hypothetical protein
MLSMMMMMHNKKIATVKLSLCLTNYALWHEDVRGVDFNFEKLNQFAVELKF